MVAAPTEPGRLRLFTSSGFSSTSCSAPAFTSSFSWSSAKAKTSAADSGSARTVSFALDSDCTPISMVTLPLSAFCSMKASAISRSMVWSSSAPHMVSFTSPQLSAAEAAVLEAAAEEAVPEEEPPQAVSAPAAAIVPIAARNLRREISFFMIQFSFVLNLKSSGALCCAYKLRTSKQLFFCTHRIPHSFAHVNGRNSRYC